MYTDHVEWRKRHFLSLTVGALAAGLLASACGIGQAAETVVTASNGTDVVVQTNLQVAQTLAQTLFTSTGSYAGLGQPPWTAGSGVALTTGASARPNAVSFDLPAVVSPPGSVLLLAAYNGVTRNCYGLLFIGMPLTSRLIGETTGGTYYITDPHVTWRACSASVLASYEEPLAHWPTNDPSTAGWPAA